MKVLHYLAWASGIVAAVIMILGFIALVAKTSLFGINHAVNYFHVATPLLLLSICCLLYKKPN